MMGAFQPHCSMANKTSGLQAVATSIPVPSHPPARHALHRSGPASIAATRRSEEHTSELQSLMSNSYAVFCLQKKNKAAQLHERNINIQNVMNISTKPRYVER